jgi:hypothetical protein
MKTAERIQYEERYFFKGDEALVGKGANLHQK